MAEKKQGKPYKLEDREGRQVRVYESGTVLDHVTGSIVKGSTATQITVESAPRMHQARQEKVAEAMAEAIADVSNGKFNTNVGPVQAVGLATGILWKDIVLGGDPNAYPRDRIQAFDVLTQRARLLEPKQAQAEAAPVRHIHEADPELVALLRDVRARQAEVVEGRIVAGSTETDGSGLAAPVASQPSDR